MKSLKLKVLSVALCLFLTLGIVLAIKGFPYFLNLVEDFRGYDYESKIAKQYDWIGTKGLPDCSGLCWLNLWYVCVP